MTGPSDAYEAVAALRCLGYDVLDPSFSNVVDVRLRSTRAEVTIEIYEVGFDYTCEGGTSTVFPDWADVLVTLARDKADLDARPRPAPPVWTETLDELGAWRSDTLCASAWLFVALAVAFLSGYVCGVWS